MEELLKKVLPKYSGASLTLFRGENKARFEMEKVGFCWTKNKNVAEMFARGLNAVTSGGVLLQYKFCANEIIAKPSTHSIYLGEHEYTVAPSCLNFNKLKLLESYPPVFIKT